MKTITALFFFGIVTLLARAEPALTILGTGINYPHFAAPTGLIFQAEAKLRDNFVRLTPSHTDHRGRVGGLWLENKQSILGGFDTTFQLQITDKTGHGADGIVFVLQDKATPSLGVSGHHMGFVRGGNAVAIKFDTYHYHRNYIKFDEIQITSCIATEQEPRGGSGLGTVTGPELYSDGKVHTVRIRYVPGLMQIYLDDLKKPLLVAEFRLEEIVPFENGEAWVGFTASTGSDSQNQDILSWTLDAPGKPLATPEPTENLLASTPTAQPANARVNVAQPTPPPANVIPVPAPAEPTPPVTNASQIIGLPVVDAANRPRQPRIQLPESVRLSHEVYASEDLVNWTLVTNLLVYFDEPGATNYDKRFYRFQEK
ncbi:MAG: hypothetical protein ABJC04_09785 [Verrucomicrobiota bacterium]